MFAVPMVSAVDEVDVWINVTLSGLTQANLNVSSLNTTRLLERLGEYKTSDEEAFRALASAYIKAISTQLDGSDVQAVECSVGSYTDPLLGLCVPCLAGKYSAVPRSSSVGDCTNCLAGTYSTKAGASSVDTCVACPAGTFSGFVGANNVSFCSTCQAGATAAAGSQGVGECVCKDGFYLTGGNCEICPDGRYCTGNQKNDCPQWEGNIATSPQGSSVVQDCYCKAGYWGRPLGADTCVECPPGSYCTGKRIDGVSQKYACPDKSTTVATATKAATKSTSVDDCVCEASYKKKLSDTAVREFLVGARPCACSVTGSAQVCQSDNPDTCGCSETAVCSGSKTLTCAQGHINLVANGNPYTTSALNSISKYWIIAPSNPLTTRASLKFGLFQTISSDVLKIWQCRNVTSCGTGETPPTSIVWKTLYGDKSLDLPSMITDAGFTAMYLQWTTAVASSGAAGWTATYGSNLSCTTSVPMTLNYVKYDPLDQPEDVLTQVPDTWPIVVWVGDTLKITVPEPKPGYVAVDIRADTIANGVSLLGGQSSWSPRVKGAYYLVDPYRPTTRSRLLVVMPIEPTTYLVYYSVAGTTQQAFTLSGGISGANSPDIVLTTGDTLVMSMLAAPGVVILKRYTSPTEIEYADGVVGQSSSTNAMASLTWDTSSSAPGLYYYASANSMSAVKMGQIILMARPAGAKCVRCFQGEYCYNGSPLQCPANSNSQAGSTGIENCTCVAGYTRELTDMATYVNSHTADSGGRHSCVVTEGGGLMCWGANEAYQLGTGKTSAYEAVPQRVLASEVMNVSLGDDFTCVVLSNKRTRCWGGNYYGQLGLDSAMENSGGTLPSACADAKLGGSGPTYETLHLSCALHSCCAVVLKGGVRSVTCWGRGDNGQLGRGGEGSTYRYNVGTGEGDTDLRTTPRESYASTGYDEARASFNGAGVPLMVTMGGFHACALLQVGTGTETQCWGLNKHGALGVGSSAEDVKNPGVVSLGKPGVASSYAKTLSCYGYVCCAVMSVTFQVKCWGQGAGGRLGNGVFNVGSTLLSMGANLQAVQIGQYNYAMDVNVGSTQVCALLGNNYVKCWGQVGGQVLGDNPPIDMYELLPNLQLTSGRVALQIGGNGPVTCAVLSDYRVACWGNNDYRQLGGAVQANAGGGVSVVQASDTNMTIVNLTGAEAMRSTGAPTTLLCSMCSENYYCGGGVTPAQRCPNNTASPTKASTVEACTCLRGYAALTVGSSVCQLCGAGSLYCTGGSSYATCPAQSGTTAAGSYALSQCSCLAGHTGQNGAACDACAPGTYKDTSGSGACTQCLAGTFSAVTGLNGSWGCKPCAAGSFSANAGAVDCTNCADGTAAKTGSSVCVKCGAGFYSFSGSEGCVPCAAGTYDQFGSGAHYTCTSCQAGYASPVLNATNSSTCKICVAGFRSDTGSASCTGCDAGWYSIGGTNACEECPLNSESLGNSTYAKCTCKAGFYKKFSTDFVTFTCVQCPAGQWAGTNATACTLCPNGTASALVGAVSAGTCTTCVAGAFAPAGTAACGTCPTWSYSVGAKGACTNCTLGQYAGAGASECGSCPAGKYSDAPISWDGGCQFCPRGYYCVGALAAAGGLQVQACPTGTWVPAGSSGYRYVTNCNACPAGSYCPTPTLQAPCPSGTTSAASSSSQLQCTCQVGYVCKYTKVINAVVTLLMPSSQFDNPMVRDKFLEAVAFASNTQVGNVRIVSYGPPPAAGRRLLQVDGTRGRRGGDGELHVFLEIAGGEGDEIVNLDGRLVAAGLAPSVDHAWYAPHAVDVTKMGELM
jgi:alpha-tubulin suppressor-like RCC1 family protein